MKREPQHLSVAVVVALQHATANEVGLDHALRRRAVGVDEPDEHSPSRPCGLLEQRQSGGRPGAEVAGDRDAFTPWCRGGTISRPDQPDELTQPLVGGHGG